jgi:tetratricopeptide (TPR) repeat protein
VGKNVPASKRDSIFDVESPYSSRLGPSPFTRIVLLVLCLTLACPAFSAEQKPSTKEGWVTVNSAHFAVTTDAGEKRGREVALRLEQMRAVFGNILVRNKLKFPVPVEVLALKSDKDYERVSPMPDNHPTEAGGFFLSGEDKHIIVLNLFAIEPWRAIAHPMAHMLLDGNYPPTQPWFDEGFAEYFSSIRVDNKSVEIGNDPELAGRFKEDLVGNVREVRNAPKSLTELLSGPIWIPMNELFTMQPKATEYHEGTHHNLFNAQSWITMHYLISKDMLSKAGQYFQLVQIEHVPVEEAMQRAFGMNSETFEKALKSYFQSLTPLFMEVEKAKSPEEQLSGPQIFRSAAPFGPEDVAVVVNKITDDDGRAATAEVMARQPEHAAEGLKDLQALVQEPADNEKAHRALAFVYMQKKEFKKSEDELDTAADENPKDKWVAYYRALEKFKLAQSSGKPMEGALANVQQNLRAVIDWYPDFAEAYHLLGLAELEGGGLNAALDSMHKAIALSPRREWYVMNLADIYISGKKWDNGQEILERLKTSANPAMAAAAKKKLDELPFLRKYGIWPDQAAEAQNPKTVESASQTSGASDEDSGDDRPKLKERPADKRPILYLKGKIVSVDCSKSPAAVVTVLSGKRTLKLRSENYKALVLVGTDEFSCEWRNQSASVNYKANGTSSGDLISLEVD